MTTATSPTSPSSSSPSSSSPSSSSSSAPASPSRLRSAGAVLAGLFATFLITTATDLVLHALGVFPPFGERMADGLFVPALAYRILFNALGAYVTARLAPTRPMRHALILGAIGTCLATLGAITMSAYGPTWYSVANVVIAFPCVWLGARLRESAAHSRRSHRQD